MLNLIKALSLTISLTSRDLVEQLRYKAELLRIHVVLHIKLAK